MCVSIYFLFFALFPPKFQKLGGSDPGLMCPSLTPELQTVIKEGGSCTVIDQPIPLDRLVVRGLDSLHVSGMCFTCIIQLISLPSQSFTLAFFDSKTWIQFKSSTKIILSFHVVKYHPFYRLVMEGVQDLLPTLGWPSFAPCQLCDSVCKVLGWPKSSFWLFCNILWKKLEQTFCPNQYITLSPY